MFLSVCAAAAAFAFLGQAAGIIACLAALVAGWVLAVFVKRQLASRIRTGADGISFTLYGADVRSFAWGDIRMAGAVEDPAGRRPRRKLFVYKEDGDVLIVIPDEFAGFDSLGAEIRGKTRFHDITLAPGEELKDRLKGLLEMK